MALTVDHRDATHARPYDALGMWCSNDPHDGRIGIAAIA